MFAKLAVILISMAVGTIAHSEPECACPILDRPELWNKEELARWMVHSLDWGVLTTQSTRLPGYPFGNVYSFVDGGCASSSGTPYFYGTFMDQSFIDLKANPKASFTLSEASFADVCGGESLPQCAIGNLAKYHGGDPENPVCARLTLSGRLVIVNADTDEYTEALAAMYKRHEQMAYWPTDHNWVIAKLELVDLWLIDYFGGATILDLDAYRSVQLFPPESSNLHA